MNWREVVIYTDVVSQMEFVTRSPLSTKLLPSVNNSETEHYK